MIAKRQERVSILMTSIMECAVCKSDVSAVQAVQIEVARYGDIGIAVAVCPTCADGALRRDGSIKPLVRRLRRQAEREAQLP